MTYNMEEKNNYEWIELPSMGQCYPIDSPLRKGKVAISYLTAMDENVIMNPNAIGNEDIINSVINKKFIDKDIDINTFVSGDREAILLWLRCTGYGKDFKVTVRKEDDNKEEFSTVIDLSQIKNREFLLIGDKEGHFPYFMKNGDIIKFKYATNKEINKWIDDIFINEEEEYGVVMKKWLKRLTYSINENKERNIVEEYIDNMTPSQSFLYYSFIEDNTPSIENVVSVNLSNKGNNITKKALFEIDNNIFLM